MLSFSLHRFPAELQSTFQSTMGYPLPLTFSFIATLLKYFVKEIGTMFKVSRLATVLLKFIELRVETRPFEADRALPSSSPSQFFDVTGYAADVPALRKRFPKIKTFQQWLEAEVKK